MEIVRHDPYDLVYIQEHKFDQYPIYSYIESNISVSRLTNINGKVERVQLVLSIDDAIKVSRELHDTAIRAKDEAYLAKIEHDKRMTKYNEKTK